MVKILQHLLYSKQLFLEGVSLFLRYHLVADIFISQHTLSAQLCMCVGVYMCVCEITTW